MTSHWQDREPPETGGQKAFTWAVLALLLIALVVAGVLAVRVAHAEPYTSDDVLAAIDEASAEIGVPAAYLESVVRCEDPQLDPYAVGRQGELGPVQLHPRGRLSHFLSLGYDDPFSPWQAIRYLAQEISFGRGRAWSCA